MTQNIQSELKKGRFRRLRALIVKESIQIIRDPSSILISAVLPLVLLFLYGFGVSLDLNHLRLGLVLEDTSPTARNFAESLTNSRYFDMTIVRDRREVLNDLTQGKIRGFIVIPSYFSAFFDRQDTTAPIQVVADGSETNTANFVRNYAQGVYQNWLSAQAISNDQQGLPKIVTQPRFWYNEQLESRFFLLPGSLAIIMTLIGTLLTALVVSREWERGTMEALMSTPASILEIVLSKFISYFVLGMLSMTICVFIATVCYGVPLRGSIWVLALVSAIFLIGALSSGLLISTLARNQLAASQAAIQTGFLPAYMLSGFVFEISSMPEPIQWLTYILPARYFVQSLQTIFLAGNVWKLILLNQIPMIAIGIFLLALTALKTVKRLD